MQQCSNDQQEKIVDVFKVLQKNFRCSASAIFKKYGFTVTQASIMFYLYRHPYVMLNEITEKLNLSKSTVSSTVDKMETQGIVIREIPKDNRRTVRLSLSEAFIDTHKEFLEFKSEFVNNFLKLTSISSEDAEKIIYALELLNTLVQIDNDECCCKTE